MKGTVTSSQAAAGRDRARPRGAVRRERSDDANAFFPDPDGGPVRVPDDLSEELGEEFVQSATSGESQSQETLNADVPEEIGGPFVETSDADEMADGVDASNPIDAEREALPRAIGGLSVSPIDAGSYDDDDTLVEGRPAEDEDVEAAPEITVKTDGRAPRRRR